MFMNLRASVSKVTSAAKPVMTTPNATKVALENRSARRAIGSVPLSPRLHPDDRAEKLLPFGGAAREHLSQISAKAGNETEPIASRTSLRSPSETGTSVMPYLRTVVHGSLPTLQRTASSNSSFEYVQISSSSCLNAASSFACCSGVNFFHVFRLMP